MINIIRYKLGETPIYRVECPNRYCQTMFTFDDWEMEMKGGRPIISCPVCESMIDIGLKEVKAFVIGTFQIGLDTFYADDKPIPPSKNITYFGDDRVIAVSEYYR